MKKLTKKQTKELAALARTPIHRHFERSRPTLLLSILLLQNGRPAQ
ncbi:MAG TPA: hypothetical protein VGI46_03565 [Candidatus Acidoferrum sp.]|jgi:hypothetical protein